MEITPQTPIADLVRQVPAAIAVLQKHGVPFCCTGRTPLSEACAHHGIAEDRLIADIERARAARQSGPAPDAPLHTVIAHIQEHYHQPLREELPRISAMLQKLVQRHGERLPSVLPPLQATFEQFREELMTHLSKEDRGLFPAIVNMEAGLPGSEAAVHWLRDPVDMLEFEHRDAEAALGRMRELTNSYTPPDDACPTFRGVYYALSELERDLEAHIRLEHDILFPRALARAHA
jgi:regulator of cell morphogenesis and NO signaling